MEKKIKSPQDLNALREKAQEEIQLRSGEKEMRVSVHMGTCGIAAGARDILSLLIDELQRTSIDNVSVRLAGCLGLCDQEPMLTLTDKSGREFCYANLSKAKVHDIVEQHIIGSEPVMEYIVNTENRKGMS